MKRGAFGSFVPGKKRKTSTLPEEVADDVVEEVCKIGGEWAGQDEEAAPEEKAASDEEHAVGEEGVEDEEVVHDDEVQDEECQGEEVQDNAVQYEEVENEEAQNEEDQDDAGQYQADVLIQASAVDDAELIDDEAVQEEDAQDVEAALDEEVEDNDQVAVEEDVLQEKEHEAVDDDVAIEEEVLANKGILDSEAAPEGETNLCDAPDEAEAEMDELAKLGKEVELAKKAAAPDSHLDDDDVPAPDYLQDQPDSDSSSSDSSDSTSASSGKAVKAISDSSSILDLLGSGSDLPGADAAVVPEVQDKEAEVSSAAQRLERKLAGDLAKLGPKKRAVRVAQLSKWLWGRLRASSLPSGLEEAHEVEALILRIAGEPDAGEPDEEIPQPLTPPRKGKRKTGDIAQWQCAEPSHREPLLEPLWPILSDYPQHSGFSIRFAKKKALCEITPVESFREEDLWFQNPGQSVSCEWCENSVLQSFGSLQGAEGRSTFSQCEFVCFTCIEEYGCGE